MNKTLFIGLIAMVIFLSGDGARAVYSSFFLFTEMNPFLVIFTAPVISLIFTIIISFATKKPENRPIYHAEKKDIIVTYMLLNFFTGVNIVTGYLSVYYIVPAVSSVIAVSVGPIFYNLLLYKQSSTSEKLFSLILFVLSALVLSSSSSVVAIRDKGDINIIMGLILSLLCGVAILCNTFLCKKLSNAGQPPLQINTLRSLLVIIVTLFICLWNDAFNISKSAFYHLIFFGLCFSFIPQICLQLAIKKLDVGLITLGIAAAPTFSAIVQVIFFDVSMSFALGFMLATGSVVIGVLSVLHRARVKIP